MTERLYFGDAFQRSFRSRVVGHGIHGERPSVVLAATGFYPEAGGQMADRGVLGGRGVLDVQADDTGIVHHVLDGELPAIGEATGGRGGGKPEHAEGRLPAAIDWAAAISAARL